MWFVAVGEPCFVTGMADGHFSPTVLTDLSSGGSLLVIGFRASMHGRNPASCVYALFANTLGEDARPVLRDIAQFSEIVADECRRHVCTMAPESGVLTDDEVRVLCVFSAAQAWDRAAMQAHLEALLGIGSPRRIVSLVTNIADALAGLGLAIHAPAGARRVPHAMTPAFQLRF
ncbi:MAG: hypothetical protein AAGH41_08855 [Pseudomonadota bacterium]